MRLGLLEGGAGAEVEAVGEPCPRWEVAAPRGAAGHREGAELKAGEVRTAAASAATGPGVVAAALPAGLSSAAHAGSCRQAQVWGQSQSPCQVGTARA